MTLTDAGTQMVTDPSVLFLDEPTTGLDSASAFAVAATVRRTCASKVCVRDGGGGTHFFPHTLACNVVFCGSRNHVRLFVLYLACAADFSGCQAVLCTIHQPSMEIFELFDWIFLLQAGGRVAYFGPVDKMIRFVLRGCLVSSSGDGVT